MFRFSLISFASILFATSVWAQEGSSSAPMPARNTRQLNVSFVSWAEMMDITSGPIEQADHSQFYGLALGRSVERFKAGSWGSIGEGSIMFGQANAGKSSPKDLMYQTNRKSWMGAQASLRFAYRPSSQVALSAGPVLLYRSIKWPDEGTAFEIKSGSDINLGAMADIRLRMANRWELRQSLGTLAFKASTYWAFGVGYLY